MDYKNGKWATALLGLQHEDGTWGSMFHSMAFAQSSKMRSLTTEQALRRLKNLHFDIQDEPIGRAVDCMKACLRGERKTDDYWEKTHDWALFTQLMLSTWVKTFDPHCKLSLAFADRWAQVIEKAFASGFYHHDDYIKAYVAQFNKRPRGDREIDFVDFYHLSLLQGMLSPKVENLLLDYVLSKPNGIFYIYRKPLNQPPKSFASKEASHYLAALELLAGYHFAKDKLGFAVDWLNAHKDENGEWDFGSNANDGTYFPLSDSWRKAEIRKADCTARVARFLHRWHGPPAG